MIVGYVTLKHLGTLFYEGTTEHQNQRGVETNIPRLSRRGRAKQYPYKFVPISCNIPLVTQNVEVIYKDVVKISHDSAASYKIKVHIWVDDDNLPLAQ